MMYIGVAGHLDSFAKSAYNKETMTRFNYLNFAMIAYNLIYH